MINADEHLKFRGVKPRSDMLFGNLIWFTTEDVARYLRISTNAVRIAVHRGVLSARKFNGRLYFKRAELDELLDTSFH